MTSIVFTYVGAAGLEFG